MAQKLTDGEFLELWAAHKSVAGVAKASGMSQRSIASRRRSLEDRHQVSLSSDDKRARHYASVATATKKEARVSLGMTSGVVIVFSDAHFWPGLRSTSFEGLLWAIGAMQPRAVICNGDAFDGASISRYPRIGWDSKPSVIQELEACGSALGEVEDAAKAARRDVKLVWPLGNHDARFETRLAQNAPEFEMVRGFTLKDHFPSWSPCWSCWPTERLVVKHRLKGGIHAAHNNAVTSGVSIVTGHLHSLKVTPYTDYNGTRYGVDTGTLADPNGVQFVDYSEDAPKNHREGFVVLTIHNGKLLWPEVVSVAGPGEIEFRGKVTKVAK